MNEGPLESPVSYREPVKEDMGQSTEKKSSEAENISEAEPAQEPLARSDSLDAKETREETVEAKATASEAPVDWFEPLEDDDDEDDDDDANSCGRNDAEEESLAGESERSESVAGSENAFKKIYTLNIPRRKRSHPDEGWEDCSALGEGWKRKEVVRRSGSSIGQKDVYYLSPQGDRVRSRVELASVLEGHDLSTFEYKTGKFHDGEIPPTRFRNRAKKKIRESSSSESSFVERGEGADTPDSHHRLTPGVGLKNVLPNPTSVSSHSTVGTPSQVSHNEDPPVEEKIKLPLPSSSKLFPLPSINGEIGSEDSTLVCARCSISFTGTSYDKQRKRPCCPTCWAASKTKEHPMIRFRKWIPCGQCVGCHNTTNCGQCANCKHGLQSPESRKRICRKRRCICPIRKSPGTGGFLQQRPYDISEILDDTCMSFQSEVTDFQHPSLKSSDTENFSVNVDVDEEDDMSTDDDDDWHKKRKRRSCGECKACLCRKDCGTCDFCIDKPKFGGSNKKRQKCRLRQCQRQAMLNHPEFAQQNGLPDGLPHISNHNNSQLFQDQLSRWDAERSHVSRDDQKHVVEEEEEELPMITQIFSLANNPAASGVDMENQLMKLLRSLRSSVLPILWYAIMVEGPQLQLIQCSKQSSMTDTTVLIDPGFCYQVIVQKQPLLPTHPLYDSYPSRLTSVTEVVNLLLGLENYAVCQGLPPKEPLSSKDPIILERASTCDFLVKKNVSICSNCKALQRL
uniref:methyl-CpG-binding domain protein 1b isoform X2 n=1 Tax=Monopterus albus TaxID=43700 RepID=UPI0009B47D1E|nr:methyl-CpG-binding domain protein 1-like isoform X2 [Monopterus albus]